MGFHLIGCFRGCQLLISIYPGVRIIPKGTGTGWGSPGTRAYSRPTRVSPSVTVPARSGRRCGSEREPGRPESAVLALVMVRPRGDARCAWFNGKASLRAEGQLRPGPGTAQAGCLNDNPELHETIAGLAVQVTACRALLVAIIATLANRDVELARSILTDSVSTNAIWRSVPGVGGFGVGFRPLPRTTPGRGRPAARGREAPRSSRR